MKIKPLCIFRWLKSAILIFVVLVISGCNYGNPAAANTDSAAGNSLLISNVAVIPLVNERAIAEALIINNGNGSLHGIVVSVENTDATTQVAASSCSELAAGASCVLKLTLTSASRDGGFVLKVNADSATCHHTAYQIIAFKQLSEPQAINAYQFTNPVNSLNGNFSLALPFYRQSSAMNPLTGDVTAIGGIDIHTKRLNCHDNFCSYLISGYAAKPGSIMLSLKNSASSTVFSTSVSLIPLTSGNLLSSTQSLTFIPADGTNNKTITLFNNGTAAINNIRFIPTGDLAAKFNASGCNGTLAPDSVCFVTLTMDSRGYLNGNLMVNIEYTTSFSDAPAPVTRELPLLVNYANSASSGITIGVDGNFSDSWVGNEKIINISVHNSGSESIANLMISNLQTQNSAILPRVDGQADCTADTILAADHDCNFSFSYTPATAEAGNIAVVVAGVYQDPQQGALSTVSNQINLAYNANPLFAYLERGTAIKKGINRCLVNGISGKISSCTATTQVSQYASVPGILPYQAGNGNSYLYYLAGATDLVKCQLDLTTGNANNCLGAGYIAYLESAIHMQIKQFTSASGNKSFIYWGNSNGNTQNALSRCRINPQDGVIDTSNCYTQIPSGVFTWGAVNDLNFIGNYVFLLNGNRVIRCSVDLQTGGFITSSCVTVLNDAYFVSYPDTIVMLPAANNNLYVYISNSVTSNGFITRCNVDAAAALFSNCTRVANSFDLRGISLLNLGGKAYLYYNTRKNGLTRQEINLQSGGLGSAESVVGNDNDFITDSYGEPRRIDFAYLYPAARLIYIPESNNNSYAFAPGSTHSINLHYNGNLAQTSTNVTFLPPPGITVTPTSVTLDNETALKSLNINISSDLAPGIYTIRTNSNNGIIAPSLTVNIRYAEIAAITPASQIGIDSLSYKSPSLRQTATLTFNDVMNSNTLIKSNIKLQSSNFKDSGFVDEAAANYILSINDNRIVTLSPIANLTSGRYYRVMINSVAITDAYGGRMQSLGWQEMIKFRPALKIYVTNQTTKGDLGGSALSTADNICATDTAKPNDGQNYKTLIASPDRYPANGWVMLANSNYYRADGTTYIKNTNSNQVFSFPLYNSISTSAVEAWSGFNGDWSSATTHDCVNWTSDTGWYDGRSGLANSTGSFAINYNDNEPLCKELYHLYCVQQ